MNSDSRLANSDITRPSWMKIAGGRKPAPNIAVYALTH